MDSYVLYDIIRRILLMLRFYFALWASKFAMWVYKLRGQERNDRPGLLAFKLCPDFLKHIKKPPLVITITGTNGKSTTSALVNNKLVLKDTKFNLTTGVPTCMQGTVST